MNSYLGSKTSLDQPSTQHVQSYRQLIHDQLETHPEYSWLHHLLQGQSPTVSETEVSIYDFVKGSLHPCGGSYHRGDSAFSKALVSRPTDIQQRLIILTYNNTSSIDRNIVDEMAVLYTIHPNFLRSHFYYYFVYVEPSYTGGRRYGEDDIHKHAQHLPSEEPGNEYHFSATREYEKMSLYLHTDRDTNNQTLLMFIRYDPSPRNFSLYAQRSNVFQVQQSDIVSSTQNLASHYRYELERGLPEFSPVIKQDILLCIYPYLRDLVLLFYQDYMDEFNLDNYERPADDVALQSRTRTSADKLYQIQFDLVGIRLLQKEVNRLRQSLNTKQARRKFSTLQTDIAALFEKYARSIDYFKEIKSAALVAAQHDEAAASASAALTVTRLSTLAFIFVPLSFVTSFFGMNMSLWGQGTVSMRTFYISAAVVLFLSSLPMLIRAIFHRLSSLRVLFKLVRHAPGLAFWYIGLCLFFANGAVEAMCTNELAHVFSIRGYKQSDDHIPIRVRQQMNPVHYPAEFVDFWEQKADELIAWSRKFREGRTS